MKMRQLLFLTLVVFSVFSCSFDSGGSSHKKEQFRISVVPEYSLNEETDDGRWAASFLAPTLPAIASYRLRVFPAGNTTEVYSSVWNSGDPVPADIILDYGSYDFQLWGYDAPNAGGNIIAYGNNPYTTNPAQTTVPLYLYSTYGQFPGCSGSGNATLIFDYSDPGLVYVQDNYVNCVARIIASDGTETTLNTGDFNEILSTLQLDMSGSASGIYRITLYMLNSSSKLVAGVCDYVFTIYDDVTITYRATAQTTDLPPLMAPVSSVSLVYDETGGLVLSWEDNCLFEENYVLTKVENSTIIGDIVLPAGTESYTDPDVSAHMSYNYNIRAVSSIYGSSSGVATTSIKPNPVFFVDPLNGDNTTIGCNQNRPWQTLQALQIYITNNEAGFAGSEPVFIYLMNRSSVPYLVNNAFTINSSRYLNLIGTDDNWGVPSEADRPEIRYTGLPSAIPSAAVFVQTPCKLQHLFLNGNSGMSGVLVDTTVPDSFEMDSCTARGGEGTGDSFGLYIERATEKLVVTNSRIEGARSTTNSYGIYFGMAYLGQAAITGSVITGNVNNSGSLPTYTYGIRNLSSLSDINSTMTITGSIVNGGYSDGNTYSISSRYPKTRIFNSTVISGENSAGNQNFGIELSSQALNSSITSCLITNLDSVDPFIGIYANAALYGTATDDLFLIKNVFDLSKASDIVTDWGGNRSSQDDLRDLESIAPGHAEQNFIIPLTVNAASGRIEGEIPRIVANGGFDTGNNTAFLPDGSIGTRTSPLSIGAHEYDSGILGNSGTLSVNTESGSDVLDGNYGPGQLTLIEALYLANLTDSSATNFDYDRIEFSGAVNTISPVSTLKVVTPRLTISGGAGEPGVTLDGGNAIRIMEVDDGTPSATLYNITLTGLSFINGRETQGGALYINENGVILDTCLFRDNQATDMSGYGGAVLNEQGTDLKVLNCVFEGNSSLNSGAAIAVVASGIGSTLFTTIDRTIFVDNGITGGGGNYGGAVAFRGTDRIMDTTITRSVFLDNYTNAAHGADLFAIGGASLNTVRIKNNTFLGGILNVNSYAFISGNTRCDFNSNIVWKEHLSNNFFYSNSSIDVSGTLNIIDKIGVSTLDMTISQNPQFCYQNIPLASPANIPDLTDPFNGTYWDKSDDCLYPRPGSPAHNMFFISAPAGGINQTYTDKYPDAGAYEYCYPANAISGLSTGALLIPGGDIRQTDTCNGMMAVAAGVDGLYIMDISDINNVTLEHYYRPDGGTNPVTQVKWNYDRINDSLSCIVFIEDGSSSRMESFNITGSSPTELTETDRAGYPAGILAGLVPESRFDTGPGNRVIVTTPGTGVQTRNIDVDGTMSNLVSYAYPEVDSGVAITGDTVFLGLYNGGSSHIASRDAMDITGLYGTFNGPFSGSGIDALNSQGGYVFAASDNRFFNVFKADAASPDFLISVFGDGAPGRIRDFLFFGNSLLMADLDNGLLIYDISSGSSATSVSHSLLPSGISLQDIEMDRNGNLFLSAGTDGLYVIRP